jgi:ABC-type uncharacterized transport system permease subunit
VGDLAFAPHRWLCRRARRCGRGSRSTGYAAIIVAYLGGLHPIGIVFSALFISVIYIGGDNAMVSANLPIAAVRVFQGSLLLAYLIAATFVRYRLEWRRAAYGSRP